MKKHMMILPLVMTIFIGCGDKTMRTSLEGNESLGLADTERLKAINTAIKDAQEAVKTAFPTFEPAFHKGGKIAATPKVQAMADALTAKCPTPAAGVADDFTKSFDQTQTLASGTCPIVVSRRASYQKNRDIRVWTMNYTYKVHDAAYGALNALDSQKGGGSIRFFKSRGKDRFEGVLEYPAVSVAGVATANIKVRILGEYLGAVGSGSIVVSMSSAVAGAEFSYVGSYNWSLQNSDEFFYLNGKPVEKVDFVDMFSAFDLEGSRARVLDEIRTPR